MKKLALLSIVALVLCSFGTTPFRVKEKSVIFTVENKDLSPVKIQVTDLEGRRVFEETLIGESKIGKVFNFEGANPNIYTIKIVDGDITYTKEVTID